MVLLLQGYQNGQDFEALSGAVTHITATPLPLVTSVDGCASVNQLSNTE